MSSTDNLIFLENLEWFDETGQELLHRLPERGSGEIKFGAQLTVRESQAAVMYYKGRAGDAFGPGRHTLRTGNIPIITKLLSAPWGMTSPLRAEVYFINLKVFPNLKWGTRDPVAFRDSELGFVRLRAHGIFNVRVIQPVLFINTLAGTMGKYSTEQIEEYLGRVIVSRLNDYLGETLDTLFSLPAQFNEMAEELKKLLISDFSRFGLALDELYIGSITPPDEVQTAIDDRSRLGLIKDMDSFVRMKAAMAMEKAAAAGNEAGAGLGMGMGLMMPHLFAGMQNNQSAAKTQCSACGKAVAAESRFCPHCGHATDEKPATVICSACNSENLSGAKFCHGCGLKL
ncbi:MAG: Membrane protease subunit, stomatin/prohibitin family, contains C-terminal Zn-ribbon domain [Candidatus Electronema aureum]|uniref:Membrane protease subunit, stomatin/prohibitin family, contains C-terminal Zn-ribbon domain n=1 Tax=Candidatus Electronema aureum TaxID=2005002 RepID=A0A521FYQ9_9BACT|nr:MAG: Membrane protease subunit, stomatin/prohibitin family, contains C-terminal Zn-ribbon domain [Candidatus Electronema aureum]